MTNKSNTKERTLDQKYERRKRKGIMGPMQIAGTAIGSAGGLFMGGPAGAMLGGTLGSAIGNGIGYFTGSGDYKVQANAVTVPGYKSKDHTVITHREYITDIKAGTGSPSVFDITTYSLNPGNAKAFPWLASIASNYEEYDIQGMLFAFVSTSGESVASTNTALGTVIMATEYDPTKPAFANKQAMENYHFATSAKPSHNQLHPIECKKSITPVKQLYIRNGSAVGDLRWTDFGNFYIATAGCPLAGATLGELWVTYQVKLLKPRLPITIGLGGQIASGIVSRTSGSTSAPLGATTIFTRGSIPLTLNLDTVSFPASPNMNYSVTVYGYGTGFGNFTVTGITGGALLNLSRAGTSPYVYGAIPTESTLTTFLQCTRTDSDENIVITFALSVSTGHSVDIIVTQLDETMN